MARNRAEAKMQKACVEWFGYNYPAYRNLLFAIPNGGSRNKIEAANLKREGVRAGVADLFLSVPRFGTAGLYIELKTPKGIWRQNQREFCNDVRRVGYGYRVIRSFDEFRDVVEEFMSAESLINEFR